MSTGIEGPPPRKFVVGPGEKETRSWIMPRRGDPRIPFAIALTAYAVLGCTVLGFNRDPFQVFLLTASACVLELLLAYMLRDGQKLFPLSAYISGISLALLLNYSHHSMVLFLPVYFTIASKYIFTYEDRHIFNPSMFGVVASVFFAGQLITTAPAYQWGGTWAMSAFLVMTAFCLFLSKIKRNALIISFLVFYILQIALRARIMRWYLPPEALFLGTLTSAPFFLFTFFMITDPKTSPSTTRGQIWWAFAIVLVDLYFHTRRTLSTFFLALFFVSLAQFLFLHLRRMWREGLVTVLRRHFFTINFARRIAAVGILGFGVILGYRHFIHPAIDIGPLPFTLTPIPPEYSGLVSKADADVFNRVDPRVQHIAKWLLSAGDAVAAADVTGDGNIDLFFTNALKRPEDRNAFYKNLGHHRFQRIPIPALDKISRDPATYGLVTSAMFVDYDNSGVKSLFLTVAYGKCMLLRNMFKETGKLWFKDVTKESGIDEYCISVAANWFDYDRDGKLDLFIANALDPYLRQYDPPRPLSIFHLPKPEYPGDRRMFAFMHSSWDNATNGGLNVLYHNLGNGRFEKVDMQKMGMPETHWSLAVGTGDLNNDGWIDLYVANDFGPDDLYLNEHGRHFRRIQGRFFGSIGKDTYKGMNASLGDIARNGMLDTYVSNVHMPLQAEGSLLWMTYPSKQDPFVPEFLDEATERGALNENRFGWGAALGDLNNDGWLDIVQANGMVDDTLDKKFPKPRSYWYVNEKLMRAGPEIHTYADMWGDLRGYSINGDDSNRVYLSRGDRKNFQFVDIAPQLGWKAETPSRGVLLADLENHGALDVGLTHVMGPFTLYRNTLYDESQTTKPHWIGFELHGDGVSCNRDAAGSRVVIKYLEKNKPVQQMREITIENGFAAQGDRRAHFGLDNYDGPVDAEIAWLGGPVEIYRGLQSGRYYSIQQGVHSKTN
jgi:Na+-translocating ferredoxin:NAD+ oxidoreductase RnfD subunit